MPLRIYRPRGFSGHAVRDAAGKTWLQWNTILEKWGVEKNGHTATARYLREQFKLAPWWLQAVTSRYEWKHGLKKKPAKKSSGRRSGAS